MSSLAIVLLQTRDPYDWLVFGCDVMLALIGIGGIIIAVITLSKIKEQAKAAKDAADAALLNAKALINAERGRLITVFDVPGNYAVFIEAKNAGRCVVHATRLFSKSILLDGRETLPEIPIYVSSPDQITAIEEWIQPEQMKMLGNEDAPMLVADLTDDSIRKSTRNRENILWVYGMIGYKDGVTEAQRELRFCYAFWEEDDAKPIVCQVAGPSAYWLEI